ncbi:hypothetical protein [Hoeflea sp.]|uniref:hypothetical protein n=1 Tax=Hoeflea sp. TaxID=1940281 RepID=UPI003B0271AD
MLDRLPDLPARWRGLWERTLLERRGPGILTNDRPARVYWLQTPLWHADLRIPLERPDFASVSSLESCSEQQLAFIAGQEAFCGITRVEGGICTWSRLFDLNPGTALDVARMRFEKENLIVEDGIAEDYLEHWTLVPGSRPEPDTSPIVESGDGAFLLCSGKWAVHVATRSTPPKEIDLYQTSGQPSRSHLVWQASLSLSLCERTSSGWQVRLSTLPWMEGLVLGQAGSEAKCA